MKHDLRLLTGFDSETGGNMSTFLLYNVPTVYVVIIAAYHEGWQ